MGKIITIAGEEHKVENRIEVQDILKHKYGTLIGLVAIEGLADDLWTTASKSFKIGTHMGSKRAWEEASRRHGIRNPYRDN